MTKLDDVPIKDFQLKQFIQQLRDAWNTGKYQKQVVTSVPTWNARPGEEVLVTPASGGTTNYFYVGSAWISSWSVTAP